MEILEPVVRLPFFVILLLLLALARVFGEIMERLGQPSMIGEILAGVLLGPSLLNVIHITSEIKVFSEIGVFLLIIIAGMEIKVEDVINGLKGKNIWIALFGFFLPLLSGMLVCHLLDQNMMQTIFIGLCVSITALPVSVRILMDIGKLNTEVGKKIISVAIFNDVVALTLLGIVLDLLKGNKQDMSTVSFIDISISVGITLCKVIAFIAVVVLAFKLVDWATKRRNFVKNKLNGFVNLLKSKESFFAILFVFILMFASFSELVGLHFIVGAFFGAMLLSNELLGKENFQVMEKTTSSMAMGFLAPVFFASLGLEFELGSLNNIPLLIGVVAVAFASKILGGYFGGKIAGLNNNESLALGIGLNGRGIMELVIADIALSNGFIDQSTFSILVLMGILTTLTTPFLMKKVFKTII